MSTAAIPLIAAGISAAGSLVSSASQAGAARRSAGVAGQNADLAEQQGQADASLIRERAGRAAGANRAAIGGSGVDSSGSSFADALADSDINAELDAQNAIWNSKMQANQYRSRAAADSASVAPALIGGAVGAGTKALSGYGQWKLLDAQSSSSGWGT